MIPALTSLLPVIGYKILLSVIVFVSALIIPTRFRDKGRIDNVLVDAAFDKTLRRDRLIVVIALITVIALCWSYILFGAGMELSAIDMTRAELNEENTAGMAMMSPVVWSTDYIVLMFFMWWIMMIAMMLPSASPMILLFVLMNRKRRKKTNPYTWRGCLRC